MRDLIPLRGPTVVHAHNVLDPTRRRVFRSIGGETLRDLQPETDQATLCVYNGDYVLPEDLDWVPTYDDHVTYIVLPKGNQGSQAIVGAILIVVGFVVPGAQALIYVGAGLLVSGLLPAPNFAPLTDNNTSSPSPTYSVQLSGNSARVGQAIPVVYGRHLIVPDFASQPYTEYDSTGDQFYYALMCLGQLDKFTLESIAIDDTELSHFQEIEYQLVGPDYSVPLSLVNPSVVNAVEVANQDLLRSVPYFWDGVGPPSPPAALYVGPFSACGPGLRAVAIGIDIVCPKGLYQADASTGALGLKSASWFVEARSITDRGAIAGDWFLLGAETLSGETNTPIRRTYTYTVPAGRYEVRLSRQDVRDENIRAGHDVQWAGMRAYLNAPAPLEPSATFLAVKIRATSQLSGLSQRKITAIIRRWLPTWDPDTGWSDPVETQSIAWAAADILRNSDYGGQVPDLQIDLQSLFELEQTWADRGDTFNAVFDKRVTVWSALTTVLRAGRARPIMRGSVFTFVRDEAQELPAALFSMRNIVKGSFSFDYALLSDDATDGLVLEYFDEETWAPAYVTVPVPGVVEPINPARMAIMGITNFDQAEREANYIVGDAVYRRASVSFSTELEGYLPAYGDLIAVSHSISGWGISGDVVTWDGSLMTTTESLNWSVGDNYAILVGGQGDVFGPYKVVPGTQPRSMQFIDIPDADAEIYVGTERERTRFAMGPANTYARMCRVVGIYPKGGDSVEIRAVIEDNRVHEADGGSTGGGGGGGGSGEGRLGRYAPDGIPNYDAATDVQQAAYGFYSNTDLTVGSSHDEGYVYAN